MSFVLTFDPAGNGMSASKYDEVIKKLKAAGQGNPEGRLYHVAYGDSNDLHVTDVWDSLENFEAFGKTLMPILQEMEVDPGQPQPKYVHNIIEG
jgi:hypothetical protein